MSNTFTSLSPFRLFVKCALPNVVSMGFISLYYIVDGIFVGKYLGNDALAALALIFPFIMMSFALADMIAIGSSVQISLKLGLGKKILARKIFSTSIFIIFIISCVVGILEYILAPILINFLNVSENIKLQAKECMLVFAIFAPFTMLTFAIDNYLRICSKTKYSMIMNIIITLTNISLDYIFIVLLKWGLFSAALATCLGLVLGGIFGILPFLFENLDLKFFKFYMSLKLLKNIIYNGSSEFFGNISGSLYAIFANFILLKISNTDSVAAFSIISYIDSFIIMLIIAMGDAMQPALSYNFARKNFARIKAILKIMFLAGMIFSLLAIFIIFVFSQNLVGFFTKNYSLEFINFTAFALSIFALNYLFAWFNILCGSCLTAFNKPRFSLILSLCQNLFIPLCFLFVLSKFIGLNGVWISPFFAEFCVLILAFVFIKKILSLYT